MMVLLLALSGYAYLMGMLVLVMAAAAYIALRFPLLFIVPALAIAVLSPFFVLAGIITSAMWVRIEPPAGYEVTAVRAGAVRVLDNGGAPPGRRAFTAS